MQCANCFAQDSSRSAPSNKSFAPLENIIFEDNFSSDSLGHFPHKWKSRKCIKPECDKTHAIVRKWGVEKVLGTNFVTYIIPKLTETLTDSFTVEFDFMLKAKQDWLSIAFRSNKKATDNEINRELMFSSEDRHLRVENITRTGRYLETFGHVFEDNIYDRVDVPQVALSDSNWYHLSFSYRHRHISCYLDSTRIFDIPECGFLPLGLSVGLSDSAICRHVVVANGKHSDFDRLITEKKLVTHAILFECNKTVIREDSDPFLAQLATWLQKNPGISIEIDGHTDSVGSAASNLALSAKRAEEVKKQLVAKGVPAARLTTKGLGATMPLRSNKKEDGRSENRRVEFVLSDK